MIVLRLPTLAVALSLVSSVLSATRSYELTVVNKYIQPDGFNRTTTLANGVYPGPVLSANKGDSLSVNVIDKTTDPSMVRSTSIHWHGIFQDRTAYVDGVAFVTQCPIAPGDNFVYNFPLEGQTGTYWYHSHYANQMCDGLKGPLIIYDPLDPLKYLYDVDNAQTIITISDWFHFPSPEAFQKNEFPESSLINGLGRYAGGPSSPLAVVNVQKGLRYRFRLISIACQAAYTFSIDKHRMTIIEVEGVEIQPYTVDAIPMFSGQRYSVVVQANQNVGNYWIRTDPGTLQPNNGPAGFNNSINSAILRYKGAPATDPTTSELTNPAIALETSMQPLFNPASPGGSRKPDVSINLAIDVDFTSLLFRVNDVPFQSPSVPVLLQILSGKVNPGSIAPNGSIYYLPKNKLVEVTIPGTDPALTLAPHPMHLHGNTFSVVRSAGSTKYNYNNPVQRDVVSTGVLGDNVTIRFMTDSPGPWFLHCHIDFHLSTGLAVVFAVDPADQDHGGEITNQAFDNLCPTYDALPPDLQ